MTLLLEWKIIMAKQQIKIEIISDVVCPWCVIGYGRLKKALAKLTTPLELSIAWYPFELNPDMPAAGENLRQHLSKKYGTTLAESIRARAMLTEEGKKVGFNFNYFDEMKMLNTHQCHQLLQWAKQKGLQTPLAEALFEHFFSNQGEFSATELVKIADKVGLNSAEAKSILANNSYSAEVSAIERHWQQKGVHGVPLFIFNGDQALSGAQEVTTFEHLLNQQLK